MVAGIAALIPALAVSAPAATAREAGANRFDPPSKATITRTLVRFLSDGNQIVVTRRYDVIFVPVSGGFRIDGTLVEAQVDAPPELHALAEIERTRADTAFPMALDRDGLVLTSAAPASNPLRERQLAAAGAIADKAGMDSGKKRDVMAQLAALTAVAGQTSTPPDLFVARAGERRERKALPLPGGGEGEIELAVTVKTAANGRLPEQFEKTVTTRLAGTTRVSKEVWSMTPR